MSHKAPHPKLPEDEFTADLERDSKERTSSTMDDLVRDDATPLPGVPDEEEYIADPEPRRQHSRKGQAESPREETLNQPEHKRHHR